MKVSVEFAHTMLAQASPVLSQEVERGTMLASALIHELRSQGSTVTTSILLDDKQVLPTDREALADKFLAQIEPLVPVDYVCFESDMSSYAEAFVSMVSVPKQDRVRRQLSRFLREYGVLPCSADIAIWHLLRLGLIPDTGGVIAPRIAAPRFSPCDVAVSILPDYLEEYEDVARKNLLRGLTLRDVESRVVTAFYPSSLSHRVDRHDEQRIVSAALKEIIKCRKF